MKPRRGTQPAIPRRFVSLAGMSLVEVLAVISVMGILAAILVPAFGYLGDKAESSKAKKNAQTVAQVSGALAAAGVEHVIPDSMGGEEATIRLLRRGIWIPDGPFAGTFMGIPTLSTDEIAPATEYLDIIVWETVLRMIYDTTS